MILAKLAKPVMEKSEGLNHLWIRFVSSGDEPIETVRVRISMPQGVYRSINLNGYPENGAGEIMMERPTPGTDLLIELRTHEEINADSGEIFIYMESGDMKITRSLSIDFGDGDDDEKFEVDREVVERLKELRIFGFGANQAEYEFTYIPPVRFDKPNEYAELEKKYRIDF